MRKAGRWLIRRLVKWGLPRLISFMRCRIDTFMDRYDKARTKRRKAWLGWRIKWRRRVIRWLVSHKAKLKRKVIRALDSAYDEGLERIPWDAVGERYGTWIRKHAA